MINDPEAQANIPIERTILIYPTQIRANSTQIHPYRDIQPSNNTLYNMRILK
jgi:hypothetical protein